jgi:hypothetical protein
MALKLAVIFVMFAGLVTYAQNSAQIGPPRPLRRSFDEQLKKAGYVKIEETPNSRGLVTETYALRSPSKPHYHQISCISLTCRGDEVVVFDHDEDYRDIPD